MTTSTTTAAAAAETDRWLLVKIPSPVLSFDKSSPIFYKIEHGIYNCALCGHHRTRQAFTEAQMTQHCKSDVCHISSMESLVIRQGRIKDFIISWGLQFLQVEPRTRQLGRPFRDHVHADMLQILTRFQTTCSINANDLTDFAANTLLVKYEQMERVSLLELAIWKASCVMDKSEEPMTYYEMLEYMSHGWKNSKTKMRRCNAIEVIIQNVLPFLAASPKSHDEEKDTHDALPLERSDEVVEGNFPDEIVGGYFPDMFREYDRETIKKFTSEFRQINRLKVPAKPTGFFVSLVTLSALRRRYGRNKLACIAQPLVPLSSSDLITILIKQKKTTRHSISHEMQARRIHLEVQMDRQLP